ncbi:hypothetical protein IV102_36085 [bacterium]|nr:hypothetical protein [bacterium]
MKVSEWTQPRYENAGLLDFARGHECSAARCLGIQTPANWGGLTVLDGLDLQEPADELGEAPVPRQIYWPLSGAPSTKSQTAASTAPVTVSAPRGGLGKAASTQGSNSRTTLRPARTQSVPEAAGAARPVAQAGPKATLNLPPRPEGSMTGRDFIERTRRMSRPQREALILEEIQKGNVPDFARQMKELQVSNNGHSGTLRVMPDYLAIGSNEDFVRIPMDAKTAQRIADQTGTSLPTTKMVDDVYRQADLKLKPQPLPPGAQMMSSDYYLRHNTMVEQQMASLGAEHGQLTAGHQKDLVISNQLTQHPDRVAIYGWHQPNGKPIQPLSTIHESSYADYSHGVRLVGGTMIVDGVERPVAEVLRDPELAGLISKEGVIRDPRVPQPA